MARFRSVILAAVIGVAAGAVLGYKAREANPLQGEPFFFFEYPQDNYVQATGSWHGDKAASVSSATIECSLSRKNCRLLQADVMDNQLTLYSADFEIVQSSASMVTATNIPTIPCVRQTMLLDRKAQSVTLTRTKISKEEVCAGLQDEPLTWTLGN